MEVGKSWRRNGTGRVYGKRAHSCVYRENPGVIPEGPRDSTHHSSLHPSRSVLELYHYVGTYTPISLLLYISPNAVVAKLFNHVDIPSSRAIPFHHSKHTRTSTRPIHHSYRRRVHRFGGRRASDLR